MNRVLAHTGVKCSIVQAPVTGRTVEGFHEIRRAQGERRPARSEL